MLIVVLLGVGDVLLVANERTLVDVTMPGEAAPLVEAAVERSAIDEP